MKKLHIALHVIMLAVIVFLLVARPWTVSQQTPEPQTNEWKFAVTFQPGGKFTDAERAELNKKLVDPYVDYNTCMGTPPLSMLVKPSETGGLRYVVEVVFPQTEEDGAPYHGFLYGESSDAQPYWEPDMIMKKCVDVLPNADALRDRAIDEYKG